MLTLLSMFCRYSAHLARINSLFLISTQSVPWMLSECCQAGMLSEPAVLMSLRLRMAFSTSSKDGGSSTFGMIGCVT